MASCCLGSDDDQVLIYLLLPHATVSNLCSMKLNTLVGTEADALSWSYLAYKWAKEMVLYRNEDGLMT